MQRAVLLLSILVAMAGCGDAPPGNSADLGAGVDLAESAVDLADVDLMPPDMRAGRDLYGVDLASPDLRAGPDLSLDDLAGVDLAGCPLARPSNFGACVNLAGPTSGPTCIYPGVTCVCADTAWVCS